MKDRRMPFTLAVLIGCVVFTGPLLANLDQSQSSPTAQNRTIHAKDGDTIVVEGPGRVAVVRRREGVARVLFNQAQHGVVILFDGDTTEGARRTRAAHDTYTFYDISTSWPLSDRWEDRCSSRNT